MAKIHTDLEPKLGKVRSWIKIARDTALSKVPAKKKPDYRIKEHGFWAKLWHYFSSTVTFIKKIPQTISDAKSTSDVLVVVLILAIVLVLIIKLL